MSQGVSNRTYLGRIDGEDGGSGGLEMREDKKSYLHFFKETLIMKSLFSCLLIWGSALLRVDQGQEREIVDECQENLK